MAKGIDKGPVPANEVVAVTPDEVEAVRRLAEMLNRQRAHPSAAHPFPPKAKAEPQSGLDLLRNELIASAMEQHPGLTHEEALKHLEAYGG